MHPQIKEVSQQCLVLISRLCRQTRPGYVHLVSLSILVTYIEHFHLRPRKSLVRTGISASYRNYSYFTLPLNSGQHQL